MSSPDPDPVTREFLRDFLVSISDRRLELAGSRWESARGVAFPAGTGSSESPPAAAVACPDSAESAPPARRDGLSLILDEWNSAIKGAPAPAALLNDVLRYTGLPL